MTPKRLSLVLALALAGGVAAAQDRGEWRPASKTAESITGAIAFSDDKITIDFATFPLAEIHALTNSEVVALFSTPPAPAATGVLYRVSIPASKKFLNKNTLCGSDETDWVATYASGRTLQLALFSGQKLPVLSAEALANTTSLCGTFTYTR
jgi:hypothetical protein